MTATAQKLSDTPTLPVVTLNDLDSSESLKLLLQIYGLSIEKVNYGAEIPGTHFGEPEAGLIGNTLYLRKDTPLHSALHEACHYICMGAERRHSLHTNAGGDYDEENAVCYLSILLADKIEGYNRNIMMQDMDSWGYTFRLGSARSWFEEDAAEVRQWLITQSLITNDNQPTGKLRD